MKIDVLSALPPGEFTLLPFQQTDLEIICNDWRERSIYLGWEMGLGKTVGTIMAWNALGYEKILIVGPASSRMVWKGEIPRWSKRQFKVQTITSGEDRLDPKAQVVIVSYELALSAKFAALLLSRSWDLVVYDEAHALGNRKSKRTRFCCGNMFKKVHRSFFLSGSISSDKIINVWPIFRTLDPVHIPTYWKFVQRYIYTEQGDYGLKFLGGKNLKELGQIARENFLLRRKKKTELKDLPEKFEQKLLFEIPELTRLRQDAAAMDFAENEIQWQGDNVTDPALVKAREELGIRKIPYIVEAACAELGHGTGGDDEYQGEKQNKIGLYVYHRKVYESLRRELVRLGLGVTGFIGGATQAEREQAQKEFQQGKAQIFLATFAAAESINLTAASTVLVGEMAWTLSKNEQVVDRFHRIGQKSTVYAKFLLAENSLDTVVWNVYKRKASDKRRAFE